MKLSDVFTVIRARRGLLIAVWVGTVAVVAGVSALIPPRYAADAAVVVEMKTSDPIAGIALPGGLVSNHIATQVDIIQSERVALRAMRALHLQDDPDWRKRWQLATEGRGSFDAWAAEQIVKKLDVRPSRDSSVIGLSYTSLDPELSANMVNALVQAYMDTAQELHSEPARRYNEFFDERARGFRDALEQAQNKLSAYQQRNGLIATDERYDVENSRLAELSSQVVDLQATAAGTRSRQRQAQSEPNRMEEVLRDPVAASLTTDLSREEGRLAELESRLGDQHPQVISQRQLITELRARLRGAMSRASGSVRVADSVAQGKLGEQKALLAEQRTKVLQLKGQRDEALVLQRDVESAQRIYDSVLSRASQTQMQSIDPQSNISVLKHASLPMAAWPKLGPNAVVAFAAGLLLGLGAVLMAEHNDRRLRTPDDVAQLLGYPLLVVLNDSRASRARPELKARVVHGLEHSTRAGASS